VVYATAFTWTIGTLLPLYYAFTRGSLPRVAGIRLLSGPFERLGMDAFIVAGLVYVVVSGLRLLAAYWLWAGRRDGAVLDLVLVGLSLPFWYGFALPFGPIGGVVEVVLLVFAWSSLR
jgi:hypothetical protein